MSEEEREETLCDGDLFTVQASFTALEMDRVRDFEGLVDYRLSRLKEAVMERYRLRRPPAHWPYWEEER